MRIICNELKKIWSLKILVIIVILSGFVFISMSGNIAGYPRGVWFLEVDMTHHLTEKYGTTLTRDDFEDFLKYEETIIQEVNEFIASRQVFIDAGIFDLDDYLAFRYETGQLYETLTDEELKQRVSITAEMGFITRLRDGTDIQPNPHEPSMAWRKWTSFHNVVERYRTNVLGESEWEATIDSFIAHAPLSEREKQRAIEIRDSGEITNIMTFWTVMHTWRYAVSLAPLVIFATLILVSQLITTDRASRVNWLQYSSKQGRDIFKKQFLAVLISAVFMTTLLVVIFAGVYGVRTEVYELWNNGINSFLNSRFYWFSITFGQYSLLISGIMYLLSIGTATVAFVFSRFSRNVITLLLKIIPLFIASAILSDWILEDFLAIHYGGDIILQFFALAIALFVAGIIAFVVIKRERRVELVN